MNFLEQLVSEWYSYQGYFVQTNVKVGKRKAGGFEGELDVVAYHPERKEVVHIETSMDAHPWDKRRQEFKRKFQRGARHIPGLFPFLQDLAVRQEAVFGFPRTTRDKQLLGERVEVYLMPQLVAKISKALAGTTVESGVIPENYPLLRAMQFALDFGGHLKPIQRGSRATEPQQR